MRATHRESFLGTRANRKPLLVEFVTSGRIRPTRTLEIGAGAGTNALWLAERGFDVLGIDVAPLAIERAIARLDGRDFDCRFAALDFLGASPAGDLSGFGGSFQFVFDRGCFHVFDEPEERTRFAARVAAALVPGGLWLSLIGSTEGGPREMGPPQRSACEVALAIEPSLEIVELRGAEFRDHGAKAWFVLRAPEHWRVASCKWLVWDVENSDSWVVTSASGTGPCARLSAQAGCRGGSKFEVYESLHWAELKMTSRDAIASRGRCNRWNAQSGF